LSLLNGIWIAALAVLFSLQRVPSHHIFRELTVS
jgi:hypothetical protein